VGIVIYPKAFIRLLTMFHRNIRATEKDLKDKRLTLEERSILKGWFLLRKNKISEVIELIQSITSSQNEFVESQKKLLLGICYNNLGQLSKAEEHLSEVPKVFSMYPVKCLEFIAYYNLYICYFNKDDVQNAEKILTKIESLRPDHFRHELLLLQCQFMSNLMKGESSKAETLLIELDNQTFKMSESMKLGHYYDKFNFYLSQKKLADCLKCINEMKKCRSFNLSENFLYMKMLLELLVHDKSLYVYSHQFKLNHHLYYHLKVIQSIQSLDVNAASLYWKKLILFDPQNYFEDFKVKDESSLLSLALNKYRHYLMSDQSQLKYKEHEGRKEKVFADLIQNSSHPIPKDVIHQLIWGSELRDKDDMIKLKKLVSRVRQIFHLDIRYKNNCYYLIRHEANVA
jgi:tetratricopeptide (TPR) repeat protein